jgi:hypothetical protein
MAAEEVRCLMPPYGDSCKLWALRSPADAQMGGSGYSAFHQTICREKRDLCIK